MDLPADLAENPAKCMLSAGLPIRNQHQGGYPQQGGYSAAGRLHSRAVIFSRAAIP